MTGVVICLNGVPIHWRSNRQPNTTMSPVESEIYALSKGLKDTRLMGWVLKELNVVVEWPLRLLTDSGGAMSFKSDACPTSKIRGCFDFNQDWVEEIKTDKLISLEKVAEAVNLADIFTKSYGTGEYKRRKVLMLDYRAVVGK